MRFPAKITSSFIWVAFLFGWVIVLWYACGADGRSVGRAGARSRDNQNFSMGRLPNFLTHGAALRALRASAVELPCDKTFPSRSQGLDFFIYVSEEERKRLETRLKIPCFSFHCTGPYTARHVFVYSHILSLCSLCLSLKGCCIKYHFAPFLLFYFMCFRPIISQFVF